MKVGIYNAHESLEWTPVKVKAESIFLLYASKLKLYYFWSKYKELTQPGNIYVR